MTDATDDIHGLFMLMKWMIKEQGLEKELYVRKYKTKVVVRKRKSK